MLSTCGFEWICQAQFPLFDGATGLINTSVLGASETGKTMRCIPGASQSGGDSKGRSCECSNVQSTWACDRCAKGKPGDSMPLVLITLCCHQEAGLKEVMMTTVAEAARSLLKSYNPGAYSVPQTTVEGWLYYETRDCNFQLTPKFTVRGRGNMLMGW